MVYFRDWTVVLRNPEIVHPATEILGKLSHSVAHRDEPASSGQLLYSSFELLEGLFRPPDFGPLKGKAEEVDMVCWCNPAFILVDPELESPFQETLKKEGQVCL